MAAKESFGSLKKINLWLTQTETLKPIPEHKKNYMHRNLNQAFQARHRLTTEFIWFEGANLSVSTGEDYIGFQASLPSPKQITCTLYLDRAGEKRWIKHSGVSWRSSFLWLLLW